MRRLTRAPNIAIAALWVDMLGQAGITASVQRYFLGAAAGELPPDQCLPEIWVTHDEQEAQAAWMAWFEQLPDTPCIAICSTSQGDPDCKGCGRTFEEVQRWTEMSPAQKRQVWRRITLEGDAWRFNRYAERAGAAPPAADPAAPPKAPAPGGD